MQSILKTHVNPNPPARVVRRQAQVMSVKHSDARLGTKGLLIRVGYVII